jgi:hypothetical protein
LWPQSSNFVGPRTQRSHRSENPLTRKIFVAIAGVGTSPVDEWSDKNEGIWPTSIETDSAPDIGLFSVPNELATDDQAFSWARVETAGADFLGALNSLIEVNEVDQPEHFVAALTTI